jgi:hypothetical protein
MRKVASTYLRHQCCGQLSKVCRRAGKRAGNPRKLCAYVDLASNQRNVDFAAFLRRLLAGEAPDNMQELDL